MSGHDRIRYASVEIAQFRRSATSDRHQFYGQIEGAGDGHRDRHQGVGFHGSLRDSDRAFRTEMRSAGAILASRGVGHGTCDVGRFTVQSGLPNVGLGIGAPRGNRRGNACSHGCGVLPNVNPASSRSYASLDACSTERRFRFGGPRTGHNTTTGNHGCGRAT